jgi:cysteine synthase
MKRIKTKNILDLIGNTPIVEIKNLNPNPKVRIFAKLEKFNPSGSIKDRIAWSMIESAEEKGVLNKKKIIIEPTSGNTGISLAMIAAVKGYKIKIVMPKSMSIERRKILKAFGADLILVKDEEWRDAAIRFTKDLLKKDSRLIMLNQYENPANPEIHYRTTGREILNQLKGIKIDYFVAGIGTGGTITGVAKRLKEKFPNLKVIGIEPKINGQIQGLKSPREGYIPPVLDFSLIDKRKIIADKTAVKFTHLLAKKEGIFVGISSGAVMACVYNLAKKIKKAVIVTIFPDGGERYLSTGIFQE